MTGRKRQPPFPQATVRQPFPTSAAMAPAPAARPLVSVVMPVHNRVRYCAEAIDSILSQTLADFELVIVDDGSTDGTSAFLEWYRGLDVRIRLFRNEVNRGVSASLNHGIAQARCDLVVRMDSDDISLPERLARQVAFMTAHPEILAAGSALRMIDAGGNIAGPPSKVETDPQILHFRPSLAHPTTILRREAVLSVGGYRPAFDHAEDVDLWFRLGEVGMLGNHPEVLLHYRAHPGNVHQTHRRRQSFLAEMAALAAYRRRNGWGDPVQAEARYEEAELADLLGWSEKARQAFLRRMEA
ncbi:glycosyltransferase [Labrys portucalensis]|uniref:Glycosyltransferase n=1 Tax=Labrys neptuniae TaxID=376174 RepID=A0ABV6ZC80_9HYPH